MTMTESYPPRRSAALMTPLPREHLFTIGTEFPHEELKPRILSAFWWNWCWPASFSRAPAPVVELAPEPTLPNETPTRLGAWWLMKAGIMVEREGVDCERLRSYFSEISRTRRAWPRYEFRITSRPDGSANGGKQIDVEMHVHREPMLRGGMRLQIRPVADGCLQIFHQERLWGE